jgi:hypothetical protein
MHQRLHNKDMEMTVVATGRARQGVIGNGVRYVLTFGLLGLIFAFSMMLVIFVSRVQF